MFAFATTSVALADETTPTQRELLARERRAFQSLEITTANPFSYVFNAGQPPRFVWRDAETAGDLGCTAPLSVRWFDSKLDEATTPAQAGRWGAYVEGLAPNGTPLRRIVTCFCRPSHFLFYMPDETSVSLNYAPGPIAREIWSQHQSEINRTAASAVLRALNDTEAGAVLLAGLSEDSTTDTQPMSLRSAAARNEDFQLALKLKVLGLTSSTRELPALRWRTSPAHVLHLGTMKQVGMRSDTPQNLKRICEDWVRETGHPFSVVVARHGVIVLNEAFGKDGKGKPITHAFRADIASLTKSITAILFSRFLDAGFVHLDDQVSVVLPDYAGHAAHVPTFRQCLNHTSCLSGHGDFGGARNVNLDNLILNGIDALEPGSSYCYTGTGFDLAGVSMEMLTGKSMLRLYRDYLFEPLGFGDVPMENCGAGARPTAYELAVLGQWLVNRGSYGEREFVSEETFQQVLPVRYSQPFAGADAEYGLGMRWMYDVKPGAPPESTATEHLIFGRHVLGHGSLTQCILRADLDSGLVIAQVRSGASHDNGKWAARFFEAVRRGMN